MFFYLGYVQRDKRTMTVPLITVFANHSPNTQRGLVMFPAIIHSAQSNAVLLGQMPVDQKNKFRRFVHIKSVTRSVALERRNEIKVTTQMISVFGEAKNWMKDGSLMDVRGRNNFPVSWS